jgi:hypothetical protein
VQVRLDPSAGAPEDPGVRLEPVLAALRSGFVVAGLLILGVGLADLVAGRVKLAEYRQVLATETVAPRSAPAALFPIQSETAQRRAVAEAKLGYYGLLQLVGQLLAALGLVLLAIGLVRERLRAPRPLAPRPSLR